MANIKSRWIIDLYEYRKVVPMRLRGYLPPVSAFANKPNRTECTQSFGTANKAEANRKAAELGTVIDRAFAKAESRQKAGEAPLSRHAQVQIEHKAFTRDTAIAAFDGWLTDAKRTAWLEIF